MLLVPATAASRQDSQVKTIAEVTLSFCWPHYLSPGGGGRVLRLTKPQACLPVFLDAQGGLRSPWLLGCDVLML